MIYGYSIRKALPPRKRFAIQRSHYENGKKIERDFKDDFLKSVNESFLSKMSPISYELALQKLEKHLEHLRDADTPEYIVDDNTKKAMNKFLAMKAKEVKRGQLRPTTLTKLEYEILLISELLKGEDLLTADEETLHDLYSSQKLAISTKNKLIVLTNSMRELSGITQKISHMTDKTVLGGRVEYLTKSQTEILLKNVDELDYHIIRFAIATGLREGEIFAVKAKTLQGSYLDITQQMYKDGTFGNPKNDRRRTLPISKIGVESYEYLMAHHKQFIDQRRTFSSRIRRITKKNLGHAFSTYDLRHTFAINCLQANIAPLKLCGWMGNSLAVLQAHYIGFMVDATVDDVAKLNAI